MSAKERLDAETGLKKETEKEAETENQKLVSEFPPPHTLAL